MKGYWQSLIKAIGFLHFKLQESFHPSIPTQSDWMFIIKNNYQKSQDEFSDYRKNNLYSNEHVLDIFKKNLTSIILIAKSLNVKPVFMLTIIVSVFPTQTFCSE